MVEVRIVGSRGNVQERENQSPQGSRGASLNVTNPMPTEYTSCQATTAAGNACKAANLKGQRFCLAHSKQAR